MELPSSGAPCFQLSESRGARQLHQPPRPGVRRGNLLQEELDQIGASRLEESVRRAVGDLGQARSERGTRTLGDRDQLLVRGEPAPQELEDLGVAVEGLERRIRGLETTAAVRNNGPGDL